MPEHEIPYEEIFYRNGDNITIPQADGTVFQRKGESGETPLPFTATNTGFTDARLIRLRLGSRSWRLPWPSRAKRRGPWSSSVVMQN